ncbi:pyruvate dehydrogenase complex family protein [Trichuris suis]|nr:pyruvate dehydrogenase complex family protein [Trichuris suis]
MRQLIYIQWCNIDLQQVIGSGPNGRVTKKDVLNHIEKLKHASMDISETFNPVAADYKVVPIRGYARTMLKNMTVASSIPHFTFSDEVNMNGLVALKESLKQVQSANGAKITYMPFFVKALSLALHKYPIMNAQFDEKRSSIVHQFVHNVCFAVDTPNGLVAPAIKSCERKSVLEIASEMFTLRKKAVEGTLSHEELTGGTITLSNIGTIGGTYASPVLLPPQVTIGAIGRIQLLPRYDEERRLQPTFILCVSWSADHRVLDGAIVAKFSNIWKEYVETPSLIDSTFH